jgi:hypothetical protein
MASDFPGSPVVLKGALVVFGAPVPTNLMVFLYHGVHHGCDTAHQAAGEAAIAAGLPAVPAP